ncbi:MAG: LL-diaminopimelate aminotransferase [Clostridiales bacterium]|nr:LL-diaminopimelate aminotransferase [Clostridiales bacterium]
MRLNGHFQDLKQSYLFITVAQKVNDFQKARPDADVIRLGIGDVTLPLVPAVTAAMRRAVDEMGDAETFRGYSSDWGYEFLREAIRGHYAEKGVKLDLSEIFITDGAKSDAGNISDIFDTDNKVLIPDPVYPVYVDSNIMAGRELEYIAGNEGNGFLPLPDGRHADIIYLCSPNNPTGAVYSKEQLRAWVDYANANSAIILFDSAYEMFVGDKDLPTSILQMPGAETCAIEIASFSKTAGFTGVRCGYTVVPNALKRKSGGKEASVNSLWLRRQTTKFNGVSYITQRGAEAAFSPDGYKQIKENIDYYKRNTRLICDMLSELGIWYTGGENAPYVWMKCPNMSSWEFFDFLLDKANVVGTPGEGFGVNGEGYFRLTGFGGRENLEKAVKRIKAVL